MYERSNKLITHRIKELNVQTINHEKLEHGPINTTLTALVDDAINARDMHDSIMIDRDVIEIDRMENLDKTGKVAREVATKSNRKRNESSSISSTEENESKRSYKSLKNNYNSKVLSQIESINEKIDTTNENTVDMTGINQYFKLKSQSQVSTKPSEINFEAEAQEKFNKWRLRYKGGALSMNVTIAMRELLFEVKVAKLVYYMGDTELDEYFTMKISF